MIDKLKELGLDEETIGKINGMLDEKMKKYEEEINNLKSRTEKPQDYPPDYYNQLVQYYLAQAQMQKPKQQPQEDELSWEQYFTDENYGPAFKTVKQAIDNYKKEIDTLRNYLASIYQSYVSDRTNLIDYISNLEVQKLHRERYLKDKEKYKYLPDVDHKILSEELRKIAQEKNIGTWDGAYEIYLSRHIDNSLDNYKKDLKMQEAQKPNLPPTTEIVGSETPQTGVDTKPEYDYESAWKQAVKEISAVWPK